MKLISDAGQVKVFRSRELLKSWLDISFDGYDESVLKHPFRTTIYWDICPYASEIHDEEHFVWNSDKDALDKEQNERKQEI